MSFAPHSRRFDARRLFPAIESDGEETSGAPNGFPFSSYEESINDPSDWDIDKALEQVWSDGRWVCPSLGEDRTRDALHSGEFNGRSGPQDSHANDLRPLRGVARTSTATSPSPDGDRRGLLCHGR
jgi:hypothetical protein